nr:immunoglobulin heavy chain junction region [Macaca mulatta]MOX63102.1 immunoglobulin heavy chain junction region [Macaca mulatta]MOX65769.1 immunoglobulin heavy chain junction region [Macaca mulatta]
CARSQSYCGGLYCFGYYYFDYW